MWIFLLVVSFLVAAVYFNSRMESAERRIRAIERRFGPGVAEALGEEMPSTPTPEELAKVGIHEGNMFRQATAGAGAGVTLSAKPIVAPMPAPVPAPSPEYARMDVPPALHAVSTFADASQEERGARWLGRIGAVAVLIGVAFFLKLAFDNGWIDPSGRVAIGIIAGIITIGIGQKLRAKYLNYSDILMGCGMGILYLSLYASYGFYHLVPSSVVFALMGLVTAFGLLLAYAGSTMGLAILALFGGFLTPVLLSTGENHLVTLSVYMIILNLGVFGVAWMKKWIQLNYLSFVGTCVLFGGWVGTYYDATQLWLALFFLTTFFLIFLATSVLHHILRSERTTAGDLMLLTFNAAGYFSMSSWMLDPRFHDELGYFALLLSLLYVAVAYLAYTSNRSDRTLNLFLPGIAIVFLTIAIPLQLSGYWISLAWLVEALALTTIGLYLRERVIKAFGWIVLVIGMLHMVRDVDRIRMCLPSQDHSFGLYLLPPLQCDITPFLNMGFFLMLVAIFVFCGMAWLYCRFRDNEGEWRGVALFAVVAANLVTLYAFSSEISLEHRYFASLVWLIEALMLLLIGLRERSRWTEALGWLTLFGGLVVMMGSVEGIRMGVPEHYGDPLKEVPSAFANLGFFLMALAIGSLYGFAACYVKYKEQYVDWKKVAGVVVVLANLLTIAVVTSEISFSYDRKVDALYQADAERVEGYNGYMGGADNYGSYKQVLNVNYGATNEKVRALRSSKNTAITVFWALYATLLLLIGFAKRLRMIRIFGLLFFFVTAGKVFLTVWQLGQLQRIISSIVFGVIALGASFLYAKYKDRLKELVLSE